MFKRTNEDESKSNYMEQLDAWTEQTIIGPLHLAWKHYFDGSTDEDEAHDESETAMETAKKAIREKVLESYRNGKAAAEQPRPSKYARSGYRK